MRKTILLAIFLINITHLFGQKLQYEEDFIVLSQEIVNLKELKEKLVTNKYEDTNSIFVQADIKYIGLGRELNDKGSDSRFFIWHDKSLFFHNIDYWLKPTEVDISEDKASYKFETISEEKLDREYFKGEITFEKHDNKWVIIKKKIKKTKCNIRQYQQ